MLARRAALVLRALAILAIVIAPVVPDRDVPSERRTLALVVDESASLAGATGVREAWVEEARALADEAGVDLRIVRVRADARLAIEAAPDFAPTPIEDKGLPPTEPETVLGTDLEAGVRLALAALPDEGARRIALLTDGRETRGDVRAAIQAAREEGIPVDVIGLGEEPERATDTGTRLGALAATETRLSSGEPAHLRVPIEGPPHGSVTVRWTRDGRPIGPRYAYTRLDAEGKGEAQLVDPTPPGGFHLYEVTIERAFGQHYRGNTGFDATPRRAALLVGGKPRVLVVTLLGDQPTLLVDALRQMDADVEHLPLVDRDLDAARLSGVDLVILADLPLARDGEVALVTGLTHASQQALITYVGEQGGGLVVTGGAFGFGPDYASTPLARVLPVAIEDRGQVDDPPVALAISLDRSGSMGAQVGAHTKMELAIEASLAAAAALRATDRIAIASVDVRSNWHQPLATVDVLAENRGAVRAVTAGGGGIYVYTALADAYRVLQPAGEPVRHVILFSDTADSEEQWQGCPFRPCRRNLPYAVDLARDARAAGITTSVVGIGNANDSDTPFLQALAAAGGGRFYLTTQGADLRRIFVTETRAAALSNLREEPTPIAHADAHPMTDGIGAVPTVAGYVQSQRRPTADTPLVTAEGHPVLAGWRYGLGQVVALTTDGGGRWTDTWNEWSGAGQLMRQVARYALRRAAPTAADARLTLDGRRMHGELEVAEHGEAPAEVEAFVYGRDGEAHEVQARLVRTGPERWSVQAEASPSDVPGGEPPYAVLRVRDAQGRLMAEAMTEQSGAGELHAVGPDDAVLSALASLGRGARDPSPQQAIEARTEPAPAKEPLWPWLFALAALLVTVDLFVRRLEKPKARALPAGLVRAATPASRADERREAA
ncbi:MAG: hypothetical protein MUE69_04785 [Myxococcota bacterium]|jgi:uncharacterized membrane protein|nr:hypothetical protein [Myxococcota bacterium]